MAPVAYYGGSKVINRKDYEPDVNAVHEMTDAKTGAIVYFKYRKHWVDDDNWVWKKVAVSVKSRNELEKISDRKVFKGTDEDRKKHALSTAMAMGVEYDPKNLNVSPEMLKCRCGFETYDQKAIFRHRSSCTYVLDMKLEAEKKKIEDAQQELKDKADLQTPDPMADAKGLVGADMNKEPTIIVEEPKKQRGRPKKS